MMNKKYIAMLGICTVAYQTINGMERIKNFLGNNIVPKERNKNNPLYVVNVVLIKLDKKIILKLWLVEKRI